MFSRKQGTTIHACLCQSVVLKHYPTNKYKLYRWTVITNNMFCHYLIIMFPSVLVAGMPLFCPRGAFWSTVARKPRDIFRLVLGIMGIWNPVFYFKIPYVISIFSNIHRKHVGSRITSCTVCCCISFETTQNRSENNRSELCYLFAVCCSRTMLSIIEQVLDNDHGINLIRYRQLFFSVSLW